MSRSHHTDPFTPLAPTPRQSAPAPALLTDLYQLTMLQSYYEHGMEQPAAFEFFVRKLPPNRGFLMAAGLEQVLEYLENLAFTPGELEWVRGCGMFASDFADRLERFRFTGSVHALPEGTVCFPDEPLLRITAPLPEAQFVETRLLNLLHFQTLVASKAARMVLAAPGRLLVDFGLRRAHGAEAGLLAARAGYLAGLHGSATVEAGRQFGIPVFGTMAHSYVQAHDDEETAFEHFARSHPGRVVLLIDTYDTEAAARKVVRLAQRLSADGIAIAGVRLDSGDLAAHATRVRRILNDGGLSGTTIFASGGLDEWSLEKLLASGAPISGFGIGTQLDTSGDAPSLDCAYKLQEYAGAPRRKRSEGKVTWPGRKQVLREYGADGRILRDTLTLEDDPLPGTPLLGRVMDAGKRIGPAPELEAIREHAARELATLPAAVRPLTLPGTVPVQVAPALTRLAAEVDHHTG
ncbi:MAG: nicotinate phosphoribosyltransferase [Nitrospirota bacterium]|nr:nicotinate phosphoribosyltransferase [Nitrospirota bacterium]